MAKTIKGIVCIAILIGVAWFWMRYFRQVKARETYNQAVECINKQKPSEAIPLLDAASEKGFDDPELMLKVREHYAKAYASEGERLIGEKKYEEAYQIIATMKNKCIDDMAKTSAYVTLCQAAYETNRLDEAIAAGALAAKSSDPGQSTLWKSRAEKKKKAPELAEKAKGLRTKSPKDAIPVYEEIVKDAVMVAAVKDKYPCYYLAECYLKTGNPAKAEAAMKQAREQNPPSDKMKPFYDALDKQIAAQKAAPKAK